eukprot:5983853-Karenia_brevis.AAC.1
MHATTTGISGSSGQNDETQVPRAFDSGSTGNLAQEEESHIAADLGWPSALSDERVHSAALAF